MPAEEPVTIRACPYLHTCELCGQGSAPGSNRSARYSLCPGDRTPTLPYVNRQSVHKLVEELAEWLKRQIWQTGMVRGGGSR